MNKINGNQVQDETLKENHISPKYSGYDGIPEAKLDLDVPTATLNDNAVLINADRTVEDGINVSFPYILLRDTVNGKTYRLHTENGTLVTTEV